MASVLDYVISLQKELREQGLRSGLEKYMVALGLGPGFSSRVYGFRLRGLEGFRVF